MYTRSRPSRMAYEPVRGPAHNSLTTPQNFRSEAMRLLRWDAVYTLKKDFSFEYACNFKHFGRNAVLEQPEDIANVRPGTLNEH